MRTLCASRGASLLQDACYHTLRLTGWLVVTGACVAALWLLLFVLLGNFSVSGTVLQIDNFAARYGSGDADEQHALRRFVWITTAGLFVAISFLRRLSLKSVAASHTSKSREIHHD